jgi:hypothetical protein
MILSTIKFAAPIREARRSPRSQLKTQNADRASERPGACASAFPSACASARPPHYPCATAAAEPTYHPSRTLLFPLYPAKSNRAQTGPQPARNRSHRSTHCKSTNPSRLKPGKTGTEPGRNRDARQRTAKTHRYLAFFARPKPQKTMHTMNQSGRPQKTRHRKKSRVDEFGTIDTVLRPRLRRSGFSAISIVGCLRSDKANSRQFVCDFAV